MMYLVDTEKFRQLIKEFGNASHFSKKSGMILSQVSGIQTGRVKTISPMNVERIALVSGLPRNKFMIIENGEMVASNEAPGAKKVAHDTEEPTKKYVPLFLEDCDKTITGLKRKIEQRLLVSHSIEYVIAIMETVDDIIKESSYFGLECAKHGADSIVMNAVQKRRVNDSLKK